MMTRSINTKPACSFYIGKQEGRQQFNKARTAYLESVLKGRTREQIEKEIQYLFRKGKS
ncbi:MAG: hypothetical protein ABFD91_04115 [Anaerohalosphaeraceae bacterium]